MKLFERWRKRARTEPGTAFPARGRHDATVMVDPLTGPGTGPGTVVIPELADEDPATVAREDENASTTILMLARIARLVNGFVFLWIAGVGPIAPARPCASPCSALRG